MSSKRDVGPPTRHGEADLSKVRTHGIGTRPSKVRLCDSGRTFDPFGSFGEFFESLPGQLAVPEVRALAGAVVEARRAGRPVVLMFGGHVIKLGLAPYLIDLVERGFVTHLATNGAGAIHDLELAFHGETSEDVASRLDDGSFGFARETAQWFAAALDRASSEDTGLGQGVGRSMASAENREHSLLHRAVRCGIPVTVHVAVGAEIVHQHPGVDGAQLGSASLRDFRILAHTLGALDGGGVVLNVGSSVILPEVFLKALTVARNLGHPAHGFVTANLDMIRHYRPTENVVDRPTRTGGRGIQLTGHHEIMLPLLYGAILWLDGGGAVSSLPRCPPAG